LILEGMLVGGAAAFAARKLGDAIPSPSDTAGAIAGVILRRAETWAIAGAALGVWLAIRTRRADFFRLGMWGLLIGAIGGAIGGAIWALPVLLPNPDLNIENIEAANWIEVGSLAVTGGFLGALLGALWRPPRLGAGLASGIVAGALIQLIVNETGWGNPPKPPIALTFGIKGLAIAGLAITALLALDRRQSAAAPLTDERATDP
jgi:uncharacterized membrane protein